MKRAFISAVCIAVVFVLAASCNKIIEEPISSVEGNGRTVINGVAEAIGNGTKAYNAYCYEVRWQANDEIYVTQADGTNDLFVLEEGEDTPTGKFVEKGSKGITGDIEAFYPASIKDGNDYVWPAVQTNNQVAPMYAKQAISGAGAETVKFSSLGAMLQIVFNSTTPDITVTSITIKDATKPLSGKFSVDSDGKAVIDENAENVGITLDLGTGVAMGSSANYFYIAIPAGTYSNLTLTLNASNGMACEMTSTTFPEVKLNTVGRLTLSGKFKLSGALPGKFTVAEGKQVWFSSGNLYWDGDSFEFETDQTAFASVWNASHVSHFFWREDAEAAYDGSYDGTVPADDTFFTEKTGFTANGQTDTWRTLSVDEWLYLIDNNEMLWTTVNGVEGLIFFCDGYSGAKTGLTSIPEGCVFLPGSGVRYDLGITTGNASYWGGDTSWSVSFNSSSTTAGVLPNKGCAVRLVAD